MPRTAGTGLAALVACGAIFAGTASAHQDSRERDVASSGVTEADPADVDPPALSDEQLDVVAASREAFGFDSDRALIASLVEDPDAWARVQESASR